MTDRDTLARLAFIRYLARLGETQSKLAEPVNAVSVLTLHDSIEMFLVLAAEKLQATLNKNTQFEEYWAPIDNKLAPKTLAHKTAVLRLNKARVNMKHYGTAPAKRDVESFRAVARNFFVDNTPAVFGVKFDDLSLEDLVAHDGARAWLRRARSLLAEGKKTHALGALDIALKMLTAAYTENKRNAYGASEFFIETIPFPPRDFASLEDFARTVSKSLAQIQERLILLGIGVDFRKYVRFRMLAPHARPDGDEVVFYNPPDDNSEDAFDFCLGFVVETALTLQEADYEVRHAARNRFVSMARELEAAQETGGTPDAEPSDVAEPAATAEQGKT